MLTSSSSLSKSPAKHTEGYYNILSYAPVPTTFRTPQGTPVYEAAWNFKSRVLAADAEHALEIAKHKYPLIRSILAVQPAQGRSH